MANDLKFVDSVASSPTTLLDLNDRAVGGFWLDSLDAPPPNLRRGLSDAILTDGQLMSTSAYDNRTVSAAFRLMGTADQTALAIQSLGRAIDQPLSLLRWQPQGATKPVFFRVLRSSLNGVDESLQMKAQDTRRVEVELMAEPAAYGLPVDIASFTISNDPTTGTNKMMVGPSVLGTIKGDLRTPLLLAQTTGPGITVDSAGALGYLMSYALDGGNTHSLLARDLTELTSSIDVGATVTGAGSNYIGGNYKHCSFASSGPQTRLFGPFSTALTPMPGEYRVLLRMVAPTSGALAVSNTTRITLRTDGSTVFKDVGDPVRTDFVYSATVAQSFLLDFGVVQFPPGVGSGGVGLAADPTTTPAPYFQIIAEQTSAGGGIRFDELFLLPTRTNYGEARTALVAFPTYSATLPNNVITYDGLRDEMVTRFDASGTDPFGGLPVPATAMSWMGGLPMLRPGWNNYLTFLYNALPVTGTTAFTGRYYPRYLYTRPAST